MDRPALRAGLALKIGLHLELMQGASPLALALNAGRQRIGQALWACLNCHPSEIWLALSA